MAPSRRRCCDRRRPDPRVGHTHHRRSNPGVTLTSLHISHRKIQPCDSDTNKNSFDTKTLTVSVELGHLYTQYHTRYIPIGWKLTIATTPIFSGGSDRTTYLVGGQPRNRIDKLREIRITRGVAIATMRSLAIQMGISLAAQNRRLNSTTIGEMRTHGVPASQETSFLCLGLDRIIDLIRNTVPSDTTN